MSQNVQIKTKTSKQLYCLVSKYITKKYFNVNRLGEDYKNVRPKALYISAVQETSNYQVS